MMREHSATRYTQPPVWRQEVQLVNSCAIVALAVSGVSGHTASAYVVY